MEGVGVFHEEDLEEVDLEDLEEAEEASEDPEEVEAQAAVSAGEAVVDFQDTKPLINDTEINDTEDIADNIDSIVNSDDWETNISRLVLTMKS